MKFSSALAKHATALINLLAIRMFGIDQLPNQDREVTHRTQWLHWPRCQQRRGLAADTDGKPRRIRYAHMRNSQGLTADYQRG